MPALNKLYQQYRNQVEFLVVYITEAHPTDVWQMESNLKDKVLFASPRSEEERAFVAGACVRCARPSLTLLALRNTLARTRRRLVGRFQ